MIFTLFCITRCRTIKVGTGFGNTIKGFVYAQSQALEICDSGFIALANDVLIRRPLTFDQDIEEMRLCNILDLNSLEEVVTIKQIPEMDLKMVKNDEIMIDIFEINVHCNHAQSL